MEPFLDRWDAGRAVAERLAKYRGDPDGIVLALPRGGVPVGYEVARALGLPLDVVVVRKIGLPGEEEFAIGAVASGGVRILNEEALEMLPLDEAVIDRLASLQEAELARREEQYRGSRPFPPLAGRDVILVDDGLATGSTMRAAVRAVRARGPRRVVVAVPVGPEATCATLAREADELVCVRIPEYFMAVGAFYESFGQTSDEEVRRLLDEAAGQGARDGRVGVEG